MLDQDTRTAILKLREQGHGTRAIARALGLSRGAVKDVLRRGSAEVPALARDQKAAPLRDEILALYASCKGNLVRVHEELVTQGATLSYPALTAFCRRHGIGHEPPAPAGRYEFAPGQEMQHDTSPHDVKLGGKLRRVQTASVVLCYSRMIFIQLYPRFDRFTCKVFLTDALRYFGGACGVCMIDNTHVVVLRGTGKDMVPVPEMEAFAERFHFEFQAHEKGDANRSARVEGPFDFVDNNFLAGREFEDWDHLNREAVAWCDKVNAAYSTHLRASRRELFAVERAGLRPLPIWVPEVYALHQRIVDLEGYVTVHTNRYSVPYALIGRPVEVRETRDSIRVYDGPRPVAEHRRLIDPVGTRVTVPEHRPPRGVLATDKGPSPDEKALVSAAPEIGEYLAALKQRTPGRGTLAARRLRRMLDDYPRRPLCEAIKTAAHYGLYDLDRVERLVLRNIATGYFFVPRDEPPPDPTAAIVDDIDDSEDPDDDDER
jgi:transposase